MFSNKTKYQKKLKIFIDEYKEINLHLKNSKLIESQEMRSLSYALSNIYLIFQKIDKNFKDYDCGIWWFTNLCYLLDNLFYFIREITNDEKLLELCNCYLKNQIHFQIKFIRKLVSHPFNIDPILEKDFDFMTRNAGVFNVLYSHEKFWENSDDKMQVVIIKNKNWVQKKFSEKLIFNRNGIVIAIETIASKKPLYLEVNLSFLINSFVDLMVNEMFEKIKTIS